MVVATWGHRVLFIGLECAGSGNFCTVLLLALFRAKAKASPRKRLSYQARFSSPEFSVQMRWPTFWHAFQNLSFLKFVYPKFYIFGFIQTNNKNSVKYIKIIQFVYNTAKTSSWKPILFFRGLSRIGFKLWPITDEL